MSYHQSRPVYNYPLTHFNGDNQAALYPDEQIYGTFDLAPASAADAPRGMRHPDSETVNPRALLQRSPDLNYTPLSNYATASIRRSSGSASNGEEYFSSAGTSPDMLPSKLDQRYVSDMECIG